MMEELIKILEEIKEHQMQTVQLARTTTVYRLADKAIQQALSIADISQQRKLLDWLSNEPDYNIGKGDIEEILQDFKYYQSNFS